ncbi:MAG: HPr(Ser) kinase/phosphatase [Sterolibacteriaceae bacterium MAG5]|nr:HPr(Ser) kinase/phosphatase [Candidatus Nitricoxidireducens bremensis]
MAVRQLIIAQLFERNRARLQLSWVCGTLNRVVSVTHDDVSPADLVGHLNLIHPDRLQVLGSPEITWTGKHSPEKMRHHIHEIISAKPPALIVADGCEVIDIIREACEASDTPLFTTPQSAAAVIDALRLYVSRYLAETITLHGVFMDVLGMGVLITGDSGVGKSELGLELISRGHGLVADDVVEVSRVAPDALEGRCPELLKDFLEVRGLGLLNIRTVFGETACRRKMKLKLIVHLQRPHPGVPEMARLPLDAQTETILGVPIRKVVLPVAAGRNLAVLLEAAVRATILYLRGIDTMQEFLDRQQQALENGDEGVN